MKRLLSLFVSLLIAASAFAETFTWEVYPNTNYTGYTLLHSKAFVAGAYRADYTNWVQSWVISGRLVTNITISLVSTNLAPTNWFYLEATGPTAGTNVVYPSPLSFPVTAIRDTNRPGNLRAASVEVQSTTSLVLPISWRTEQIVQVDLPVDAEFKAFRSFISWNQGSPVMPVLTPPPIP